MPLSTLSNKEDIRQFQFNLQLLGVSLRGTKADGIFGAATKGAAHDFADAHKITDKFDGVIPDSVVNEAARLANLKRNPVVATPPKYLDLTASAWPGPRKGERAWTDIDSITIHQTGCKMPANNPKRWSNFQSVNKEGVITTDSLHAHIGITTAGEIYHIHPFTSFVWHAQGLSHKGIGLEISGLFNGLTNDPKTFPGTKDQTPSHLTPEQIESVRNFIRYTKQVLQAHGSDLKSIIPHRCSSEDRRPDCGQELYETFCLWAEKELGLDLGGPNFKMGTGFTIPEAWNPAYKGNKY